MVCQHQQNISRKKLDKRLYLLTQHHTKRKRPTIIGAQVGGNGEEICGISMLAHFLSFLLISQDFVPFNLRTGKKRESVRRVGGLLRGSQLRQAFCTHSQLRLLRGK
jgi:hypothetical protein